MQRCLGPSASLLVSVLWLIALVGVPIKDARAQCGSAIEVVKLLGSPSRFDHRFGWSMDAELNTLVVGAPGHDLPGKPEAGAAFVFTRANGTAAWQFSRKLVASDAAAFDNFGFSVAIQGDEIFVGAINATGFDGPDQGAVYQFTRTGTVWTQGQKLIDNVTGPEFRSVAFGAAITISNNWLLVGDPDYLNSGDPSRRYGRVILFERGGSGWVESINPHIGFSFFGRAGWALASFGNRAVTGYPHVQSSNPSSGWLVTHDLTQPFGFNFESQLLPNPEVAGANTGASVDLLGSTLLAGAPEYTSGNPPVNSGSAHIFTLTNGIWSEYQLLLSLNREDNDEFGRSVKLASSVRAFVGAPFAAGDGRVYEFERVNGLWQQEYEIAPPEPTYSFGYTLAFIPDLVGSPKTLFVASPFAGNGDNLSAGRVYVYQGDAPNYTVQILEEPTDTESDQAGTSVAIFGDFAVVGAPLADTEAGVDAGAAYVYRRVNGVWSFRDFLEAPDGAASDNFGRSVAISADTILVGAPQNDTGAGADAGSVYVFVPQNNGWAHNQTLLGADAAAGDLFGTSVAISGTTLMVGAPGVDSGGVTNHGCGYIFNRGGDGQWSQFSQLLASDRANGDEAGVSVAIGNLTSPTVNFIALLGATLNDTAGGSNTGSVYVFRREAIIGGTAWVERANIVAPDGGASDLFGASIALTSGSPPNGAGTVAIGSYLDNTAAGSNAGSVYVFTSSSSTTWTLQEQIFASDAEADDRFGSSVALSGSNLLVGAPLRTTVGTDDGAVYYFRRSGTDWQQQQKFIASDRDPGDQFGLSLGISGASVIVGSPLDNTNAGQDSGSAYVFDINTAAPTITQPPSDTTFCPTQVDAELLVAVSGGGPFTYAWQYLDGVNWVTFTSDFLPDFGFVSAGNVDYCFFDDLVAGSSRQFRVRVTNACGTATSAAFTVSVSQCDCIDFIQDGVSPDLQDLIAFFEIFQGGRCPPRRSCGDIDFNNDGVFPDLQDAYDMIDAFAGGSCP